MSYFVSIAGTGLWGKVGKRAFALKIADYVQHFSLALDAAAIAGPCKLTFIVAHAHFFNLAIIGSAT